MRINQLLFGMKKSYQRRVQILKKKGNDYSKTCDTLSNFKEMSVLANILGIKVSEPEGYCLMFVLIKLHRICNLIYQGVKPKNESINDSIDDMQNYLELLRGLLNEKRKV